MTVFSSLRMRLVGTVLLAIIPAWLLIYYHYVPWGPLLLGLLALAAAWFGGEHFILRQIRQLSWAARRLAAGDLKSRTGIGGRNDEFGQLARTFDEMAKSLEKRSRQQDQGEKSLLHRSLQQTVVGALGQFALVSKDLPALLNQVVLLVSQTLEVEYCRLLELAPDAQTMRLQAGSGWGPGWVGVDTVLLEPGTEESFTLQAGEPVVFDELPTDRRFHGSTLMLEHGVVSGISVAVAGNGRAFGILGVGSTRPRRFTEDEVHFLLSIGTLLAMAVERHRAEAQMQKLAAFAQLNPNPAMELAADGSITYFNDAALKLALSIGQDNPRALLPAEIEQITAQCLATRASQLHYEAPVAGRTLSWSFHPVLDDEVVHVYVEDITERLNLEAQLRQSQKMESVGQLAAGVAHDFNNMLTIIQGHSGMLLAKPALPAEFYDSVQAVYFASERAANLTRQLLMFSRKNVMQPKLLDVRQVVGQMSKMLERLLGETIKLELHAPDYIPMLQGDAGMIEQVLMNLAVNARDAMPKGGGLTISTSGIEISESFAAMHSEARPGIFVCMRVTDTGCGMDKATMRRIFEPFFTTKEVGKGTGLGLATVYGIVKQHGGWVDVQSELGRGTTFTVFFPAMGEPVLAQDAEDVPMEEVRGGKETILVVEDEPVLRDMAHVILRECGYEVLEAATGHEALRVWERHRGEIDLLLTDMVMPEGMSGMELAERLLASNPDLKIIFASGYSMDELDTDFIRDGHAVFLQKPYTHVSLSKTIRECLDGQEMVRA
ncbi:MAG TPA: ATP-binding protein [Candidatus Dormibacteraeota bacterium]|nr:ATP-binding protein [Candidatus Dormibacteraeota bacterium]